MDWRQLLFKIVTITLALLTSLVSIYLIHHQGERNEALDSDTLDYDQHDYIKSSDCSQEYDGFCLNDGVCFFPETQTGFLAFVDTHMRVEGVRSICGEHSTKDPSHNQIFIE